MAGFEDAWAAIAHPQDGEAVSPELEPLLRRVYTDVLASPADLGALKEGLGVPSVSLTGPPPPDSINRSI